MIGGFFGGIGTVLFFLMFVLGVAGVPPQLLVVGAFVALCLTPSLWR